MPKTKKRSRRVSRNLIARTIAGRRRLSQSLDVPAWIRREFYRRQPATLKDQIHMAKEMASEMNVAASMVIRSALDRQSKGED